MHSPSRAGPTLTPWCLGRGKKSRKKRRQSRDSVLLNCSSSRETRPASESAAEPTATPERREGRGKRAAPLLRELQEASLFLTLRGGHLTCDRRAPLVGDIKPLGLTPGLTGGAELGFVWAVPGERRLLILFSSLKLPDVDVSRVAG